MICDTEKWEVVTRIATTLTGENWTEVNIYREEEDQADTTKDDSRNCCLGKEMALELGDEDVF
jgi:hypothetical protein